MEVNFKFEIGEIVTTKESVFGHDIHGKMLKSSGRTSWPIVMAVQSRFMEECPGGIQLFYNVQYFTAQGYVTTEMLEEFLVKYPEQAESE